MTCWILAFMAGLISCIMMEYEKTDTSRSEKENIKYSNIAGIIGVILIILFLYLGNM